MTSIVKLVTAKRGHFKLESGMHGALWLDLDGLFTETARISPLVDALGSLLARHELDAICGPMVGGAFLAQRIAHHLGDDFYFTERTESNITNGLFNVRYHLPPALRDKVKKKRVAIVDDVMSAGSSLRATYDELRAHGAEVVIVGALLVLGDAGYRHFSELGLPVEYLTREPYDLWSPDACPLCADSVPLEVP